MGHAWLSLPQPKILIDGEDFTQYHSSMAVRRRENGFDTATINIVPPKTTLFYGNTINKDDPITISFKDRSETAYTDLLSGVIRRIEPTMSKEGHVLKIECDGSGYGLGVTQCGEEYGSESTKPTLDTIKEIIEDNTNGIIDLWVNKVLGSAVDSGYSYTTQVETVAGAIKYVYFPYKTNTKTINDLCDIVQGIKGANAGVHWIVDTSNRFLLATVGNHGAPASTFWPTWWKTDRAGSTLTEGEDFLAFNGQTLSKEANYVLYHGKIIKPLGLDKWTNNNSEEWHNVDARVVISDDASAKVGTHAIKLTSDNTDEAIEVAWAYYPSTDDLGLDVTALGGKYGVPVFHCWMKIDDAKYAQNGSLYVVFTDSANQYFGYGSGTCAEMFPAAGTWTEFTLPIGPYWMQGLKGVPQWFEAPFESLGGPDWSDIQNVGVWFSFTADDWDVWIDNFYVSGSVIRGARQAAAYTAADPLKMKVITDNVAKDDSLNASDDSGLIARLAYAEYLRLSSTPIVGTFICPIMPTLKAGQLIHIHAWKKSDGTYAIDDDFRVMRLTHAFTNNGVTTTMQVTDDILNSNPRPIPDQYNTILNATKPEFQTRQATSIKARDIDITQPILEKTY